MLHPETIEIQNRLSAYVKTGVAVPVKGTITHRLKEYRRLVVNIFQDNLQTAFPITYSYLPENQWNNLVERFMQYHNCQTAEVWNMPGEFKEYIIAKEKEILHTHPILFDLLSFEWAESYLYVMPDIQQNIFTKLGSLTESKLILNKEYDINSYEYPIHLKHPADIDLHNDKGNYFLILFRHPETGKVNFIEVSAIYVFIIGKLSEKSVSFSEIINETAQYFQIASSNTIKEGIYNFLEAAFNQKLILGFSKH